MADPIEKVKIVATLVVDGPIDDLAEARQILFDRVGFFDVKVEPLTKITPIAPDRGPKSLAEIDAEVAEITAFLDEHENDPQYGTRTHGRLREAAKALARLEKDPNVDVDALTATRTGLHVLTERLLRTVFGFTTTP